MLQMFIGCKDTKDFSFFQIIIPFFDDFNLVISFVFRIFALEDEEDTDRFNRSGNNDVLGWL